MTFDPVEIVRTLSAHGVRYAVVGGFALAAQGVVRATEDLDVVTDRGLENAERLAEALAAIDGRASEPLDAETLHLLRAVSGIPTYRDLDREVVEIDGVEFDVSTRAALKEMKRAAGRDKDLIDLAELEALEEGDDAQARS